MQSLEAKLHVVKILARFGNSAVLRHCDEYHWSYGFLKGVLHEFGHSCASER